MFSCCHRSFSTTALPCLSIYAHIFFLHSSDRCQNIQRYLFFPLSSAFFMYKCRYIRHTSPNLFLFRIFILVFFFILKFILVSSRFYSNVASIKTIMLYTCNQCMLVFRRKFTCKRQRGKKRKKKSSFFLFRPLLRSIRFSFHIILFVACCFFFLSVDRHFRWKNINAQICLGRNVFVIYVLCVRVCAGLFFFAGSFGSEVLMRCDDFEMCYIFVN